MIPLSEIAIRLLVATLLSAIVGMERERLECAAGLRTHAMVGLGAALFMVLSAFGFHDILGNPNVVLDPSRMAAQIVSGIGFLGAGLIIFQREVVRGLTTAASVWVVAAVGAAAGGKSNFPSPPLARAELADRARSRVIGGNRVRGRIGGTTPGSGGGDARRTGDGRQS